MGLLEAVVTQARVWLAYTRLGSSSEERAAAMQTLLEAGPAALPCLLYTSKQRNQPRVQFAAAIVLHRMGRPEGMEILIEDLRYRPETNRTELESAFIAIGSPDAVTALLGVWWQVPEWNDEQRTLMSICRIWAALRDPRPLDALCARATRIPGLFLQTVPSFGEMAVLHLERMTRDPDARRRILAIRALSHTSSRRCFTVLTPLLRDADPDVRAAVPRALETTAPPAHIAEVLSQSILAGYSTPQAVEMLAQLCAPAFNETLLEIVARWNPQVRVPSGDTAASVMAALSVLEHTPWNNARLFPTLCALLERRPDAGIAAKTSRILGARRHFHDESDALALESLPALLAHLHGEVRAQAAESLFQLGEPLGRQMVALLDACRPQGNLLAKLHAILRGGPDASQAATQAVQQVSQWLFRISKETVERLSPAGPAGSPAAGVPRDARVPDLLRRLLAAGLEQLPRPATPEETEERLSVCVAAVRALARVGAPGALCAREEIRGALHLVTRSLITPTVSVPGRKPEFRDVGNVLRAAAAETLLDLYGPASFALFLEALYTPPVETTDAAIAALGRLGDVRALPYLLSIAGDAHHPHLALAQEAVAAVRRTNPEMMELLRGSSAHENQAGMLLRAAGGDTQPTAPDLLLRPSAPTHPVVPDGCVPKPIME